MQPGGERRLDGEVLELVAARTHLDQLDVLVGGRGRIAQPARAENRLLVDLVDVEVHAVHEPVAPAARAEVRELVLVVRLVVGQPHSLGLPD